MLGDRARRHACYLAVALVLRDPSGAPQNAAVLIAPGGAVMARATERRPASWFAAWSGAPSPQRWMTRAVTGAESLPLLEALAAETQTILALALAERGEGETYKTAYLIDRGTTIAAHRQSCLSAAERAAGFTPGAMPPPVVTTAIGRLGLLVGVEGLVPSLMAGLVERGATLLVWCAGDVGAPIEPLAHARAIETGSAVIAAGIAAANGGGSIIDAGGMVLATTIAGEAMAALATLMADRG